MQDHLRLGGTESQTVALANAFAAEGHAVLLVTFRPGGPLAARVRPDVNMVSLQRRDTQIDWHAPGLIGKLRAFRPDIVQLMGRMAHVRGSRLRRALPQARIVATLRTGKPLPWLYRLTLRRAHAIVANSAAAAARLAHECASVSRRIRVIRNAVLFPDRPPPPQTRARVRGETGTAPDTVVFLCAAMMRPGKGHHELLNIVARLELGPDLPWELWLAGEGPEQPACAGLARSLGLAERVRFLGARNDVAALLAAADVAVLASRRGFESLPNFLVEAQWGGVPVVAADVDGVREAFEPGSSGVLVPEGATNEFRAALADLARDRERRREAGAAARAFARAEFDPERQNRRYLDLYREVLGTPA